MTKPEPPPGDRLEIALFFSDRDPVGPYHVHTDVFRAGSGAGRPSRRAKPDRAARARKGGTT